MAKKRRQKTEKKEEFDIKLPEFDEHEYVALELRKSKLAFISFLYAILMVIITYFLYTITFPDWRGPIILGLLAIAALPFIINFIKLDTTDLDWKNWFGGGAIYFFSWLAFFILVINPPFSDFAEPEIELDEVSYLKSLDPQTNWTHLSFTEGSTPRMESPVRIRVRAKITDNSEIDKNSVKLTIKPSIFPDSDQLVFKMEPLEDNMYETILEPTNITQGFNANTFTFTIEAKDNHSRKEIFTDKFEIRR